MADILIPRYTAPSRIPTGPDGIPHYICATPGAPGFWRPPHGFTLAVYHNRVKVFYIVEADRRAGWAVGHHWRVNAGKIEKLTHDSNGVAQSRLYEGVITFKLERR